MNRRTSLLTMWVLSAAAIAGSSGARAQPTPAKSGGTSGGSKATQTPGNGLEEITVTSRKRRESAQKTPLAIAAFSGKAIQKQQITQINDLQRAVPGFSSVPAAQDQFESLISLRGISTLNSQEVQDPTVGVYIDGVYQGFAGTNLRQPYDLERIEVTKGPQGTLYGRNSVGGAISIIHNLPVDQFEAWAKAGFASNGGYEGAAMANLPLVSNQLDLRVVGGYLTNDGYGQVVANNLPIPQRNPVGTHLNDLTEWNALATLRYTPTSDLTFIARFAAEKGSSNGGSERTVYMNPGLNPDGSFNSYANSNWEAAAELGGARVVDAYYALAGFAGPCDAACRATEAAIASPYLTRARTAYLTNPAGFHDSPYAVPQSDDAKKDTVSLTSSYTVNSNLEFKSITSYLFSSRYDFQDYAGGGFNIGTSTQQVSSDQVTQELQANGNFLSNRLKYTAGGFFYYKSAGDVQNGAFFTTLFGTGGLSINDARVRDTSVAPFAQVTYSLTPDINLTGGIRYTSEKKTVDNLYGHFGNNFVNISYLGGIDYTPFRDTLLYFKTSKGFVSGGPQETSALNISFQPETVTDYEIGLKTDLYQHRLRVNLDAYHEDYSQLQQSVAIVAPGTENLQTVILNAGSAQVDGVEWQISGRPIRNTTLGVEGAYTYPQYNSFIDPSLGQLKGTPFSNVLRWSYTILGDYTLPTRLGPIDFHLDFHWQSELVFAVEPTIYSKTIANGPIHQTPYGLINGRIDWTIDRYKMDVGLFGRNLTNRHYYTFGTDLSGNTAQSSLGIVLANTSSIGRTVGVDITKNF